MAVEEPAGLLDYVALLSCGSTTKSLTDKGKRIIILTQSHFRN